MTHSPGYPRHTVSKRRPEPSTVKEYTTGESKRKVPAYYGFEEMTMRRLIGITILAVFIAIVAVILVVARNKTAEAPDPNFRQVYLAFDGRIGIGPGNIVVLGNTAYTVNQRNCTISAVDLDTGRILRWATFQVPPVGHYPYGSPYVVCEHEVLMTTDGEWLYLAVTNQIYCYNPQNLRRVSARRYPTHGGVMVNLRGFAALVRPVKLIWLPNEERLCVHLAGSYEGVHDLGWSVLCYFKPRSLRVGRVVQLDSDSLKSSTGRGNPAGPFVFAGRFNSSSRFIVDVSTGAAVPMTRSAFMSRGYATLGNPGRLFVFYGERRVNEQWEQTPALSIIDPATGISQGPLMLEPLPQPLLSVRRAEMTPDPSGQRMLITAQCNYLNRVGVALVDGNGRQLSQWYAVPGLCQLGGVSVDWKAEKAYISDGRTNSIHILSLKPLKQIRQIPVGVQIAGIWFDDQSGKLMAQGWMAGQYIWTVDTEHGRLAEAVNLHEEQYVKFEGLAGSHLTLDAQQRFVYILRRGLYRDLPGYHRTATQEWGPSARTYYQRYEKYDLRSGKLVADLDTGPTEYTGFGDDPTLIPRGPMDRLFDPGRKRLYRPRSRFALKGRPPAVEAWNTEKHAKAVEFTLPPDQEANHVLLDKRRNRLYIVTVGQMRTVDAASMKEIGRVSLPDRVYRSACVNEATGRVFLLPGSIPQQSDRAKEYTYPPSVLRIYDPTSDKMESAQMPSDSRPPNPKLFTATESGTMAADARKSEVYILSTWNAGLLIYVDRQKSR